jgi:hypothetical protein
MWFANSRSKKSINKEQEREQETQNMREDTHTERGREIGREGGREGGRERCTSRRTCNTIPAGRRSCTSYADICSRGSRPAPARGRIEFTLSITCRIFARLK